MKKTNYNQAWFADDFEVGDEAPELTIHDIDRQDFVKYAGASGDFNPIHYDEPYAKEHGHPSVFGQGMLIAGYASHVLTRWIGLKYVRRFKTRFQDRVWPGDTLIAKARISEKETQEEVGRLTIQISVLNNDHNTVLSGEAEVELPIRDSKKPRS